MISTNLTPPLTHPETAWIALAVPLWLAVAAILICTLLLRERLRLALHALLERRSARNRSTPVEPALFWTPPIASAAQLLRSCLLTVLVLLGMLSWLAPLFVASVLAGARTVL